MTASLFTLAEANRALPLVRVITRDAVQRYRAAKREIRACERRRSEGRGNREEMRRRDRSIADNLEELRRLTDELDALGCHLRDFELGVVDFPAASFGQDDFLFYCWALGEDRVSHWRGEEERFEQRHLVQASTA